MNGSSENRKIAVVGAGFAGLSAAAYLAKAGCEVDVYEKNPEVGGRARQFSTPSGYLFDMGPSWYWMPDVFERFFEDFGCHSSDFYDLKLLDPGYVMIFGGGDTLEVPAGMAALFEVFERTEKGSSAALNCFLKEAAYKYEVGIHNLVYQPGLSLLELADTALIKGIFRMQVFTSLSRHAHKYFKDHRLRTLMEFPALFLGATAEDTPAFYSLMNYAALQLGTWYPLGGFGKVVSAMQKVAIAQGARFHVEESVNGFQIANRTINGIRTDSRSSRIAGVIAAADYHHVDQQLLDVPHRNYSGRYWKGRVMAPSALIFYLGISKRLGKLKHHNLFFDEDLHQHAHEIYRSPKWPSKPLFYVSCTSKTDPTVAPPGHENLFILMPVAVGLNDDEQTRERYFELLMGRLEEYCGESIRGHLDYKRSYCVSDFKRDYQSFEGNAYGLANTLRQTFMLKPSLRNKKVKNLFYAGHMTVPGPGVPPSIISGKIAAIQLLKFLKK